jgi:plastocyanin
MPASDASDDAGKSEAAVDLTPNDSADNETSALVAGGVDSAGVDSAGGDSPHAEAGANCPAAFAGCVSFTDATAANADRTIHFQDYSYAPKCLMIRSGQTVTFSGDFIRHPLTPSCGPELLLEYRDIGTTASFVLESSGTYGYYCLDHGNPQGDVMSGAIEVVP